MQWVPRTFVYVTMVFLVFLSAFDKNQGHNSIIWLSAVKKGPSLLSLVVWVDPEVGTLEFWRTIDPSPKKIYCQKLFRMKGGESTDYFFIAKKN